VIIFTEVVVDTKDSRFPKHRMKSGIQPLCRGKVSKRLLDNDYPMSCYKCRRIDAKRGSYTVGAMGGVERVNGVLRLT